MSEVYTNWTHATTNPNEAMMGLLSCLNAGKNAWIETRKNSKQNMEYPIMKKNPELDNPFNWTMMYGTVRNNKDLESHSYFNETEKDLTYNWIACFGENDAIEEYQKNRTITKELFVGSGICHPVRIEDANYYRKEILGDSYEYDYWVTWWKPKDNITHYVIDESINEVFVICYDAGPVNKKAAIEKTARFLMDYAITLKD